MKKIKYVNLPDVDEDTCGSLDIAQQGWFNEEHGEILPGFAIGKSDTVVEVGCGEGRFSTFAARHANNVIATDIDASAIERLSQEMSRRGPSRCSFQGLVSDSDPLPIADALANKIICMDVMQHVDNPRQFLAELVRIGKPAAAYLISVPDPVAQSVQRSISPADHESVKQPRVFQREELRQLIAGAGLQIETCTQLGFFWSMWGILSQAGNQAGTESRGPILENWTKAWYALLQTEKGDATRKALDEFLPQSQVVIARKVA